MPRIKPGDSPQAVNKALLNTWNTSLFTFAQVFAICPTDLYLQKRYEPFNFREIKEIRTALEKMRKDVLKGARKIESLMNKSKSFSAEDLTEDELVKDKAIKDFFDKYILVRQLVTFFFEKICQLGRRGVGLNKKSIIALGWGNLASKGGRRIDWQMLGDLYFWFWERIKVFEHYREWSPVDGIEDYLKIQFHRHKFKGSLEDYIVDNMPIAEPGHEKEGWQFILRLLMYKWADGKVPEREIPGLILNIITGWFLAGNEGLTIFSPSGSFTDPFFNYMNLWLDNDTAQKEISRVSSEWLRLMGTAYPTDKELPGAGPEVVSYFGYASELYLANESDSGRIAPMIIFPDRSYFMAAI